MTPFQNIPIQDNNFIPKPDVTLQKILNKYVSRWPLFMAGILISSAVAFIYLRYTPPVYNIKTSVLIKDNSAPLKEFNMFSDPRAVDNEIEVLRSKALMHKVVKQLNLQISYEIKQNMITTDLYVNKPVNIEADSLSPEILNTPLQLNILDYNHYEITSVGSSDRVAGQFNVTQNNKLGSYIIKKTTTLPEYIGKSIYFTAHAPEVISNKILSRLSISLTNNPASVIELSLNDVVPQRAKDILNTLINVYSVETVEDKNKSIENSIRFIKDRLLYISRDLDEVEKNLQDFKVRYGIVDISGHAATLEKNINDNDSRLNTVRMQLISIEEIENFIRSTNSHSSTPAMLGIDDPDLTQSIQRLNDLQLKYEQLLETTQAVNPIAVKLEKQIRLTRASIQNTINRMRDYLLGTQRLLNYNNSTYEASLQDLPAEEREYMTLKRQQSVKENIYMMLLQKQEEALLSSVSTVPDIKVLEKAYQIPIPVKPDKNYVYLLALMFGFSIPVIYLFGRDAVNFRVMSSKDITEQTSVPILGEVIQIKTAPTVVVNNNRSVIAEQFRFIRTNLQYIYGNHQGPRVTLFTSSIVGEGKSFTSVNLATALAMTDRKTVLVEMDLRAPTISKALALNSGPGITDYLINKAGKEEIIQSTNVHPKLSVISAGNLPPNPSELLEMREIDELIAWLKIRFTDILIDTPPIVHVTDALIVSRVANATIYMVKQGVTLKSQVAGIERLNNQKRFPKLNIVFNGIRDSGHLGYGGSESPYGSGLETHVG